MISNSLHAIRGPFLIGTANHLWQSTLFALVIAALAFALRKNHARTRYWLWFVASTKFLLPFSLLVALGGHFAELHRPLPNQTGTSVAPYAVMEEMSHPFTAADNLPAVTTFPSTTAIGERMFFPARVIEFLSAVTPLQRTLAVVWACGFLSVVITWIMRWRRMSAAIRKAVPLLKGREVDALRRMENLGGLRRTIELRLLPASLEPGIFGFVSPVLLWPQAMSSRLEDAHLEAILAHEVSHVRRHDNLTAAVHMMVEAAFWFHPLVWWLEARLVEERERACDEEVLQTCGERSIYAESILRVCEFCVESPLACVSGITGADLKKRIVRIMTERVVRELDLGRRFLLLAVGLTVVGVPIVLGQAKASQRKIVDASAQSSAKQEAQDLAAGLGSAASPPVLIYSVEPVFTERALQAHASGDVLVNLWVDGQGNPRQVRTVRGLGMGLDQKAVEAVRQYRFTPAMEGGKPVPAQLNLAVKFQIF